MKNKTKCKKEILELLQSRGYKNLDKNLNLLDLIFYENDRIEDNKLFIYRKFIDGFFFTKKGRTKLLKLWEENNSKYDRYFVELLLPILYKWGIKTVCFSDSMTFDNAKEEYSGYPL